MANAVESSASFLRVPNAHLLGVGGASHPFASLRELGLYMMLSSVLSNPSFTYARGGMQNLLQKHCKNKYFSLHTTWRSLSKKGFLLRTRIPMGTNCFHDFYTLSGIKAETNGAPVHLTAKEGKQFTALYQAYLPPTSDFTMVSREMLMDARLSLAAKGLYAILARQIRLAAQCSEAHKPEISKKALRAVCREGKNAFDGLFRELREAGYLQLLRCHESGRLSYLYQLTETPLQTASAQKIQKTTPTVSKNTAFVPQKPKETPQQIPSSPPPPTLEDLREQIDYSILRHAYSQSRLDLIVSILENAVLQGQRTPGKTVSLGKETTTAASLSDKLLALDSEDIRYVLDTLAETEVKTKIHHLRSYMTTCLYFAKENLALSLESFSFPKGIPKPAYST